MFGRKLPGSSGQGSSSPTAVLAALWGRLSDFANGGTEHWLVAMLGSHVGLLAPVLFGTTDRKKFYRDLTHLLRSGLSFQEAVKELAKTMKDKAFVYNDILHKLAEGASPADSLVNWVPSSERLLIRAAERNSKKDDVIAMIRRLITIMENRSQIIAALWDAMLQPIMLFYVSIGTFVWLSKSMVEQMISTMSIDPSKLPGSARTYFEIFHFMGKPYGWGSVVGVSIIVPLIVVMTLGTDFPFRKYLDRVPPWSLYKLIVGAGFLYSMASLLQAKTPIRSALVDLWRQSAGWLRGRIGSTLENLDQDGLLSKALEADGYGFPDKEIIARLKLRESRGDLGQALQEFSTDWTEDGLESVKKQAQVLNYVAWTAMGGLTAIMTGGIQAIQTAVVAASGASY